eukprot:1180080-Prorocentrum_minimum.AAC.1
MQGFSYSLKASHAGLRGHSARVVGGALSPSGLQPQRERWLDIPFSCPPSKTPSPLYAPDARRQGLR